MILGYGIDIMDMKRLDAKKLDRLKKKVFSDAEKNQFDALNNLKRTMKEDTVMWKGKTVKELQRTVVQYI